MTAAPAALAPALAPAALIVAKSTLLLGAAAAGARVLRRGSAAARHLVWSLALGGLLALPLLDFALPDWKPSVLAVLRPAASAAPQWVAAPHAASAAAPVVLLLAAVWAAGMLFVLGRLAMGLWGVGRLGRAARPVTDPQWTELLERFARAVGVRRPVALLQTDGAAMPLTWGAFGAAILLPAEADGWSDERRRVVLLHELAHVARRDCLMQLLAEVCCALYWFHPGAWWAARKMRIEREQACDDLVLASGARASDYAGHLLDVARAYRAPALAAAIAMARPSHLEDRVRAVLEARRDRRAVTARTAAICAGAVLLATLPLAAVAPSERAAAAPQVIAWRMPEARSWKVQPRTGDAGSIHVSAEWFHAPRPAAAPSPPAATPSPSAATPSSTAAPARANRRAEPARARRPEPRREAPVRLASGEGGVVARVSGGQVHAVVAVPEGVTVRVEGHGVRAAASRGQLRIDADLSAIAARLARAADSADCPKARAVQAAREKKLSEATRRLALARKRGSRSAGDARGDAAAADVRTDDTGGA